MTDIHSCSYFCTRPACVLQQRDELRDKQQAEPVVLTDAAIEAAITAWFGWHMSDDSDRAPFQDRMRAAIKAANNFKGAQ
jgi:hypothetical protein